MAVPMQLMYWALLLSARAILPAEAFETRYLVCEIGEAPALWRSYTVREDAELCAAGLTELYSGLRRFEARERPPVLD